MDILVADCSLGEFGWELMSWQAHVRSKADDFDKVIICTTEGLEPLYTDFADEFITHSVPLLRDCFEQRAIYDKDAWHRHRKKIDALISKLDKQGHDVEYIRAKKYIQTTRQRFVTFGDAAAARKRGNEYDIIVHARNKESNDKYYRVYNWAQARWDSLVKRLSADGIKVAAIGTKAASILPKGAVDLRGINLQQVMDAMAAAQLVVGPSSGPMHLASLCKAPHLVWTGTKWSSTINAFNEERYTWKWNPLRTPCRVIVRPNADVSVDEVYVGIEEVLTELANDDVPEEQPGFRNATKMIEFWQQRARREQQATPRRDVKQAQLIGAKLRSALGGGQFDHGIDFGCGAGRFIDCIAAHCDRLTAIDLTDAIKDRLPENASFQQVEFPTKFAIPDGTVDLFVAVLVFQHIVDDNWFAGVVAEVRRVLADSAMVIIVDDSGKPSWHVKQRLAEEFKTALDLGWYEDKVLDLDGPESHHVLIGSHRKA